MGPEELDKDKILEMFYSHKGNLDDLNRSIDAKLRAHATRKISLFEKYVRSRLELNPRVFKMAGMEVSPQEVVFLSQYPDLQTVEVLDLRKNGFGDVGLQAIAHSPVLAGLRELDLRGNGITRLGMQALAECNNLGRLEKLDLRTNKLGKRWEEKLLESGNFPHLKDLRTG